jgi:hypothetical protein
MCVLRCFGGILKKEKVFGHAAKPDWVRRFPEWWIRFFLMETRIYTRNVGIVARRMK